MPPKRRFMRRKEPKNLSGNDPFLIIPLEIRFLILNDLAVTWKKNFSRCSKHCYNMAFPLRFKDKNIIINQKTATLFEDDGLCASGCYFLRAVCFDREWGRAKDVLDRVGPDGDPNALISHLRVSTETIGLFQCLRNLHISYVIPSLIENNIYAAILNGITGRRFCGTLRRLEFQVYKIPGGQGSWSKFKSYQQIYSTLSAENQEFLGEEITSDMIGKVVGAKIPTLPLLKAAVISANGIATPLADPGSKFLELSAFYYLPFTAAPNLRTLDVSTTETSKGSCIFDNGEKEPASQEFNSGFLDSFSKIKNLNLTNSAIPRADEMERLAKLFPNLQNLNIGVFDGRKWDTNYEDSDTRYDAVTKIKDLDELTIPWPAYEVYGGVSPKILEVWVHRWMLAGLGNLRNVNFCRTRTRHEGDMGKPVKVAFAAGGTE
ncbi:hypothetical protein TWF730_001142 [Orbilia blumenaviensis]|uniref:F-box domain-containing protein n=1 Tax=Orbilia blumenaviensis TaxID=1796055 RepID=A0AAV9VNS0_9PEZI